MTQKAIIVNDLSKTYANAPVLSRLNVEINWGELIVLFGSNGAGKTTFLRILSTRVRPDIGTVIVAGYDSRTKPKELRRSIGVVGHQGLLYDDLTASENLEFYSRMYVLKDVQASVGRCLELVGLESKSDSKVRTLSHGMQKRLGIARAILHDPMVLLLDEPESGLDVDSRDKLKEILFKWIEKGRTVVMTTHSADIGSGWSTRPLVLSDGRINDVQT